MGRYEPGSRLLALTVISVMLLAVINGNVLLGYSEPSTNKSTIGASARNGQTFEAARPMGTVAPVKVTLAYSSTLSESSNSRVQDLAEMTTHRILRGPVTPPGSTPVPEPTAADSSLAPQSASGSGYKLFVNNTISAIPSTNTGIISEPSVANNGNVIFYTGNGPFADFGYFARSTDGGSTWSYGDSTADMSDFCCDQDVVFNPSRSIFIWVRQGCPLLNGVCNYSSGTAVNRYRIGVSSSSDLASWFFYDLHPTDLNSLWTQKSFDFPKLVFSNNLLWLAANIYGCCDIIGGGTFQYSTILRVSLDDLKNHLPLAGSGKYFSSDMDTVVPGLFNYGPVQNATEVMYWASHVSGSTLRVYNWTENPSSIKAISTAIPPYTPGRGNCPSPGGGDACARADDRISLGWVANGIIGFTWTAAQTVPTIPYPYIYVARFVQGTEALLDTPMIKNPNFAFLYADVAPNARGHLGLVVFCSGASSGVCSYPTLVAGIWDDITTVASHWEIYVVRTSTNGPASNVWGDYVRIRPLNSLGYVWEATGWTLKGGGQNSNVVSAYLVFGRTRDDPSILAVVQGTNGFVYSNAHISGDWTGWQFLSGTTSNSTSLCRSGAGTIELVVRGTDNALWHNRFVNGTWVGWDSPGGIIYKQPSCAIMGNMLHVVVTGANGGLWYNSRDLSAGTWGNWFFLSGTTPTTSVLVASPASNRLDLIVRGGDSGIYHKAFRAGAWASNWDTPNGATSDIPSAVSDGTSLHLVVKGSDGNIWYANQTFSTGLWSSWSSLSGFASTGPAMTIDRLGTIHLVVVGNDHGLWHKSKLSGGSWSVSWDSPGGTTAVQPGLNTFGTTLVLLVQGGDQAIWYNTFIGSTWLGWTSLGGAISTAPSISNGA